MKKNISKILGANIRYLRDKFDIAQDEIAFRADISAGYLSEIENGKSYPRAATLEKIAEVLKVEPYELYVDTGITPKIEIQKDAHIKLLEMIDKHKKDKVFNEALLRYAELLEFYKKK